MLEGGLTNLSDKHPGPASTAESTHKLPSLNVQNVVNQWSTLLQASVEDALPFEM